MIYCGIIDANCDDCYELSVASCLTTINVPCTNLTNGVTYYLWIRDKFQKLYYSTVVGKSNGSFDITASDFPTGMFTKIFGVLDIFLTTNSTGVTIQPMTFITNYNCVILSVQ